MEMAWGIIMTAFTLFGMLALMIASVTMEDTTAWTSMGEGTGPGSFPQAQDLPATEAPEFKKAA